MSDLTSGPWTCDYTESGYVVINDSRGYTIALIPPDLPLDEQEANASVVALIGTIASKLPDEYDPGAVLEGLSQLITAAEEGSHRQVEAVLSAMRKPE